MNCFIELLGRAKRSVRAHVTLIQRDRHTVRSVSYGDQNAQTVCSCGWKSKSYSSGEFYAWEARWDMARGEAYRHLCDARVIAKGAHYDACRNQEFA